MNISSQCPKPSNWRLTSNRKPFNRPKSDFESQMNFFFLGNLKWSWQPSAAPCRWTVQHFQGEQKGTNSEMEKKRSNRPLATYLDERINQTLTDGCPVTDTDGRVSSRAEIAPSWRGPRYLTCCSAICKLLFFGIYWPRSRTDLIGPVLALDPRCGCQWTKPNGCPDLRSAPETIRYLFAYFTCPLLFWLFKFLENDRFAVFWPQSNFLGFLFDGKSAGRPNDRPVPSFGQS